MLPQMVRAIIKSSLAPCCRVLGGLHSVRPVPENSCFQRSDCNSSYSSIRHFSSSSTRRGIYKPENLPPSGPPTVDFVNVRIQGYDFTLVEHYMYYVSKIASSVGAEVSKRWATPAKTSHVVAYKPRSVLVNNECDLSLFERDVQLSNVTGGVATLLMDVLNSTLPEGVTVTLKHHEPSDEEVRYVPDYELNELKAQVKELEPRKAEATVVKK